MRPAEEFILHQKEPFKSILLHLQIIIENAFSDVELHFKWNIPFYYLDSKPLCYLNPSKKKGFVDVGFWLPPEVTKFDEFLISENRKVVKSLRYYKVEEIDENLLIAVLSEGLNKKGSIFKRKNN
ncbi:DUF1801 domain-containing protein [Polaribacter sp.]|uniref:DUF1801 domain-containing protein n=1 Tax=Polaribacter sp. TaxID=1920175 RepID=UPI0040478A06